MNKNTSGIYKLLKKQYKLKKIRPHGDGISELILTILSQNTADRNSGQAFAKLMNHFGNWENIRKAQLSEIKKQITIGGMSNIKSKNIKTVLNIVNEEVENYNLYFLTTLKRKEALNWLTSLPGVGKKTASCVMLFAYGVPFIPVDTHVERIVKRIGFVKKKVNTIDIQEDLEQIFEKEKYGIFHLSLIEHGRKICQAKNPLCNECIIQDLCEQNLT
ncbi:MAG: endonuclease III domain-containing protein [Dehalococcoidia bacterium]|tara:strand:+ start:463 stop:1113 length:651 start_codon:yes stop_codon:yes gene_type:complete